MRDGEWLSVAPARSGKADVYTSQLPDNNSRTQSITMANRGYDVVVDVDAEVSKSGFYSFTVHFSNSSRATSDIPTCKRTLNSTRPVSPLQRQQSPSLIQITNHCPFTVSQTSKMTNAPPKHKPIPPRS